MSAKIIRLEEHRARRRPQTGADTTARTRGTALDQALRAVAASPSTDFASNARLFQRTFKDAIARTNAELRVKVTPLPPGADESNQDE